MYTELPYPLSSNHNALTPRTAAYCWLQCSPIPSLAGVAPSTRQRVQLAEMLSTQCWLNVATVSEPAFNQQLALPKCRPKHGKQTATRPPPSYPNGDQPYQLQALEKTALTHCSVCLSHGDAGSFCIQGVYLDGWVVYPASTIRSSNVGLKLIQHL